MCAGNKKDKNLITKTRDLTTNHYLDGPGGFLCEPVVCFNTVNRDECGSLEIEN